MVRVHHLAPFLPDSLNWLEHQICNLKSIISNLSFETIKLLTNSLNFDDDFFCFAILQVAFQNTLLFILLYRDTYNHITKCYIICWFDSNLCYFRHCGEMVYAKNSRFFMIKRLLISISLLGGGVMVTHVSLFCIKRYIQHHLNIAFGCTCSRFESQPPSCCFLIN